MSLRFVPRIVYGTGPTTLDLTYPSKLWTPHVQSQGGSSTSDIGVPESFIIRRDQRMKLDLRFLESEWISIDTWLAYAQGSNSFDYYFDKNVVGTKYTCFLDEPTPGNGEVAPTREGFTKIFNISVVLRTTDASRFNVTIF